MRVYTYTHSTYTRFAVKFIRPRVRQHWWPTRWLVYRKHLRLGRGQTAYHAEVFGKRWGFLVMVYHAGSQLKGIRVEVTVPRGRS